MTARLSSRNARENGSKGEKARDLMSDPPEGTLDRKKPPQHAASASANPPLEPSFVLGDGIDSYAIAADLIRRGRRMYSDQGTRRTETRCEQRFTRKPLRW
jgi:hypothetical protein